MHIRHLLLAAAAGSVLLGTAAMAAGSLAIGLSDNFADDGVAVGTTWNYDDRGSADFDAIEECLGFTDAADAARANCAVVTRFDGQCVAVALDPQPGTLGFGWAVAATPREAQSKAMDVCRNASTSDRASYCAITESQCDDD